MKSLTSGNMVKNAPTPHVTVEWVYCKLTGCHHVKMNYSDELSTQHNFPFCGEYLNLTSLASHF